MCQLIPDIWERIGYVAQEAVDDVHNAIDKDELVQVSFQWVKYIVFFRNRGWYAGIEVTKKRPWSTSVLRCRAKSFT